MSCNMIFVYFPSRHGRTGCQIYCTVNWTFLYLYLRRVVRNLGLSFLFCLLIVLLWFLGAASGMPGPSTVQLRLQENRAPFSSHSTYLGAALYCRSPIVRPRAHPGRWGHGTPAPFAPGPVAHRGPHIKWRPIGFLYSLAHYPKSLLQWVSYELISSLH